MQPKVSVILAIYNAEDHIARCLESVMNQTLREIEILAVNDGSTDGTEALLRQYAEKDSRIRILNRPNGGAGAARNTGLQEARGEYLSILDADDFFEPDMLEKSYARAKELQAEVLTFGCDFYEEETDRFWPCKYSIHSDLLPSKTVFAARDVEKDVFKLFVGWAWDKLFLRSYVEALGLRFQEQRTTNDMLFVFSAVVNASRITVMNEVLAHHRRGTGSLSVTREKSWLCFYHALLALRGQLRVRGLYERFERDYINYCVHFSLWNLRTLAEPTKTKLADMLRSEGFAELGITEKDEAYFYNRGEYREYRTVYTGQPAETEKGSILRRGMRCLKENGLRYTVNRCFRKVSRRMKGTNMLNSLEQLRKNRFLFEELVKRDFKQKYKRTVLGMAWSILSPLFTLLVMKLVFTNFFGRTMNHYTIYLFCGNLVFSYFKESTSGGMSSLANNAMIFSKVNVPKYMFLLSKNVSSLINFGLTLVIFLLFCLLDHIPFGVHFLMLLYPICCLVLFNIGIGLILSALFMFFRDISYLYDIFTLLLMYLSVIFYRVDSYPEEAQRLFFCNPVYCHITYFRMITLESTVPPLWLHALCLGYAAAALLIGGSIYKRQNHRFLYYV